jgi:hypothetical protein
METRPSDVIEQRPPTKLVNLAVYTGQWLGDKRHGFGCQDYPDGILYEGMWRDDRESGFGQLHYVEGKRYVGDWSDGKANGLGSYH